MVLVMLLCLAAGIALGLLFNVSYPLEYSFYITMALIAAMDSVVGAMRSHLEGKYSNLIFITGFLTNAALAGVLTFVGDKLGIPLYYAAIWVFGGRLFNNLAASRRIAIEKFTDKKNKSSKEK